MRFLLIDRITDLQPGQSITAIKNVSLGEELLQDHFPGFPIIPGVLMVECLTQAGAWLMRYTEDFKYATILLKEAKAVKFNHFVSPGQTIEVTCTVHKQEGNLYTMKAAGTCEGKNVVSARIVLEQSNQGDSNPKLAASDETQRKFFRELSEGLWSK
ncbi:MAG: beta-hydroxyacyl-ACP dehydratase [Planctomycetaceae bacterium]|nr:beta-hydroxyacyl-ACP dehydratase [Planctomycetaceae bacterium]